MSPSPGVVDHVAGVRVRTDPLLREGDLLAPEPEGLLHHGLVADHVVEDRVAVAGEQALEAVVAGQHPAEPAALDVGQVAQEPEQRERRRRHRPGGELLGVEAVALHAEGQPIAAEVVEQGAELVLGDVLIGLTGVVLGVHPHVGVLPCRLGHACHRGGRDGREQPRGRRPVGGPVARGRPLGPRPAARRRPSQRRRRLPLLAARGDRRRPRHPTATTSTSPSRTGATTSTSARSIRTANAIGARAFHIVGKRRWNRRGAMVTDRYQHEHHHRDVADLVAWAATAGGTVTAYRSSASTTCRGRCRWRRTTCRASACSSSARRGRDCQRRCARPATPCCTSSSSGRRARSTPVPLRPIAMHAWVRRHDFDQSPPAP